MTTGLLSLGSETDLLDASFTGFAYPSTKELLTLLENAVGSTGNVVVQQSSLTRRQGTLVFIARDTAEKNAIRAYDESGAEATFTDFDGSTSSVIVLSFSSSLRFGDVWDVTVNLLETSEPVPLGS